MPKYFFCSIVRGEKYVQCGSDDLAGMMRYVMDWVAAGQYPHGVVERHCTALLIW